MLKTFFILAGAIPALCISSVVQGAEQANPAKDPAAEKLAKAKKDWTAALRSTLGDSKRNLAIDINSTVRPVPLSFRKNTPTKEIAEFLSAAWKREAVEKEFGWVLVRTARSAESASSLYQGLVDWLSVVPMDELATMCSSGVPYANLSPQSKRFFAARCADEGLQSKMASGEFAAAAVRLTMAIETTDTKGKPVFTSIDPFRANSEAERKIRDELEKSYVPQVNDHQVDTGEVSKGELDFGEGEAITLSEVCERAKKAFNKTFLYDKRLSDSLYFWKGSFSEKLFLDYLKEVQHTFEPVALSNDLTDVKATLNAILRNKVVQFLNKEHESKEISNEEGLKGLNLRADELAKRLGNWASKMESRGIDPSAQVSVRAALWLQLTAPGTYGGGDGQSPVGYIWSAIVRP